MLQSVFSGACRGSPHVARAERRRHRLSDGLPVLVGVACQQVGAAQELQQRRNLSRDAHFLHTTLLNITSRPRGVCLLKPPQDASISSLCTLVRLVHCDALQKPALDIRRILHCNAPPPCRWAGQLGSLLRAAREYVWTESYRVQEGVLEAQLVYVLATQHVSCQNRVGDADHLQRVHACQGGCAAQACDIRVC